MSTANPPAWRTSTYSSNGENCVELAPAADINALAWRTSTRSGNGENCVELAPAADLSAFAWRTSTRSSNGEKCVEIAPAADLSALAWQTSTHTGNGENCVETAPAVGGVLVRHSKHPDDGTIAFPYPAWATFVRDSLDGLPGTNGIATIAKAGPDTLVKSLHTDVELLFDPGEWSAFLAGAADGEFDFTGQLTTTAT